MTADPEKVAVIVGVGQVNDRPAEPMAGKDSLGLMIAALEEADKDAGGGWLPDVDSVAVVQQISFRKTNPLAQKVADGIGSKAGIVYESVGPNGDSPILLPSFSYEPCHCQGAALNSAWLRHATR